MRDKTKNYLGCVVLEMADPEAVMNITNADVGFAGPVGLNMILIIDLEVENMKNFIVGANETGYHLANVNVKEILNLAR